MNTPNYITEINKFYDWLETNQIPKSAIALWHGLMHICNKTGWEERFTVAISTIESKTGFKRSELFEARNILMQKGRINWKQRGGNLCAEYELIFFSINEKRKNSVRNTDTSADASPDTKAHTSPNTNGTQKRTINRQDQNKQNKTSSKSHSGAGAPDKKKTEVLFWKSFVGKWNDWYLAKFKNQYNYLEKDFAHLKRIYKFLERRAVAKNFEFTEENLLAAFDFFLEKAWNKDQWLKQNFSIPNVLSQFNQIANGEPYSKKQQQPTGAAVSTSSLLSKIVGMPD